MKKFFEKELGKISQTVYYFAKTEMRNEHKAKGTPSFKKGERADKLSTYIHFAQRRIFNHE